MASKTDYENQIIEALTGAYTTELNSGKGKYASQLGVTGRYGDEAYKAEARHRRNALNRLMKRGVVRQVGGGGKNTRYALTSEVEAVNQAKREERDARELKKAAKVASDLGLDDAEKVLAVLRSHRLL